MKCCGKNISVYLKSGSEGVQQRTITFPFVFFANFHDFWKPWGGGHGVRGTIPITTITTTTFSPPPGVRNFGFSTFALCLLRDPQTWSVVGKIMLAEVWGLVLAVWWGHFAFVAVLVTLACKSPEMWLRWPSYGHSCSYLALLFGSSAWSLQTRPRY